MDQSLVTYGRTLPLPTPNTNEFPWYMIMYGYMVQLEVSVIVNDMSELHQARSFSYTNLLEVEAKFLDS